MDPRALTTLEFDTVRARLADFAAFSASRELALASEPVASPLIINLALTETSEARRLLELAPDFSIRSVRDVREAATTARIGATLDPRVLVDLRDHLESVAAIRNAMLRLGGDLPNLANRASTLDPCSPLVRALRDAISDDAEVLDRASPELGRARTQVRTAYNRLMDTLRRILDSAVQRGLAQEPLITMRAGRYVVPIRATSRNVFRGIVHDESASGATVFMEPIAAVALNNDWRHAQILEAKEVERVLAALSALVAAVSEPIIASVTTVASIDLAIARGRYALTLDAVHPEVRTDRAFNLPGARHPLLRGGVVPIDVHLGLVPGSDAQPPFPETPSPTKSVAGPPVTSLLITGPNTGGKTVALKTAGLLHLMAQSGMHIPALPGASIAVFENIYADIGDEQSIEQSLSTFSSHLTNIVRILKAATSADLVLLDELGAGTDPVEGSALARAMISHLVSRGILTIATTHYSELKAFAYETPGVQNASVEFNLQTLRPTYRLQIGVPGRSNALAIAERLGLPEAILSDAHSLINPEERRIDDMLAGILDERARARDARTTAARIESEVRVRLANLEHRLALLDEEREAILLRAKEEATGLVDEARSRIRRAQSATLRPDANPAVGAQALKDLDAAAREVLARPVRQTRRETGPAETPLRAGERVHVTRLGAAGVLVTAPDASGSVEVQLGTLRTKVNISEVTRVSRREADAITPGSVPEPRVTYSRATSTANRPANAQPVGLQLDVRGSRADDVVPQVDRYISDAFMGGMPWVRIIHGKGTGVLRQIIRQHLTGNPMIRQVEAASPSDGGEGATIVHLNN